MNKKIIWIIVPIMIFILSVSFYKIFNKWQYQHSFRNVNLKQITYQDFDMSKRDGPFWISVINKGQSDNIKKHITLNYHPWILKKKC